MNLLKQKKSLVLFTLLLILISNNFYSQTTKGKDFWFGYMYNLVEDAPLEVYVSSERLATGTLTIPGTGFSQTFNILANTTTGIVIPAGIMAGDNSDIIEGKAIHIVTCDTVSVYAINKGAASDDAAVIYPTPILGNEYMVLTKQGNPGDWGKEFLVVATANGTQIQITPTSATDGGRPAGVPYTVVLNQGDMYQVTANGDLTGTIVRSLPSGTISCSNFAVFSGSKCINIGGCVACDHLYEQIMPTKAWGKNFILGKYEQKDGLVYRVLSKTNGTSFTIDGGAPIVRNAGQFYEYSSSGAVGPSYITSNNPVMIMQYMEGANCDGSGLGDPDQVLIYPIEQTMNVATFFTIPSPIVTNFYANIAAKTSAVPNVKLNGVNISAFFIPVPSNPIYSYAKGIPLAQNTNYQLVSDTGICAFVYGIGPFESYSYPVGSSLKDLTSDFAIIEPAQLCPGETWGFQAVIDPLATNYLWNFGDGATSTGTTTTHSYLAEGTYSVTMTKVLPGSCNVDVIKYAFVKKPAVKIRGIDTVCAGTPVNLWTNIRNDSILLKIPTACNDTIKRYVKTHMDSVIWSNGSNDSLITVNPNVTTTYYLYGYAIGSPCVAKDSFIVHVIKPTATFTANAVCQSTATAFTDLSTSSFGAVTSWSWDFTNNGTIDNVTQNPTFTYPSSGTFTASLIVTDRKGCKDTVTNLVNIWGHTIPNFTSSKTCNGAITSFTNTTDITTNANVGGTPTYNWDFGDATAASALTNPTHTYILPANINTVYNATLTATSSHGCIDNITYPVNVYAVPTASFTSDSVCLGSQSHMLDASNGNGNPLSGYAWDFTSDGTIDAVGVPNPNYTFPLAGSNFVTYTASTNPAPGLVCSNVTTSISVWVNPLPTPSFVFVNNCINNQPNSFDANSSVISIGTNTAYAWAYGDASSGIGATSTHTYATSGVYNVTLTVTSNKGCTAKITHSVEVYEKPMLTILNSNACDLKAMTFTASTLPGSGTINTWNWDFNNSIFTFEKFGQTTNYIFPAAGNQTVNVVAITDHGCTETFTKVVYVDYVPVPLFTVNTPSGCATHCVTFTDNTAPITAPGVNANWTWVFGDGTSSSVSTGTTQTHCYGNSTSDQIKQYEVKLVVTTNKGCTDSLIKPNYITVFPKPIASFTVTPNPGNIVTPLEYFTNQSIDYTKFWWYFGDSPTPDSVNTNPNHVYNSETAETYPVQLIVANQYGCKDTALVAVELSPDFTFYIPNAFTPDNADNLNDLFTGSGIGIAKYEMWIYDRWGTKIYYTDDIRKGWNGKVQGKSNEVQQDVYVWKVKLVDVLGKKHDYVGHVTIIKGE